MPPLENSSAIFWIEIILVVWYCYDTFFHLSDHCVEHSHTVAVGAVMLSSGFVSAII